MGLLSGSGGVENFCNLSTETRAITHMLLGECARAMTHRITCLYTRRHVLIHTRLLIIIHYWQQFSPIRDSV